MAMYARYPSTRIYMEVSTTKITRVTFDLYFLEFSDAMNMHVDLKLQKEINNALKIKEIMFSKHYKNENKSVTALK